MKPNKPSWYIFPGNPITRIIKQNVPGGLISYTPLWTTKRKKSKIKYFASGRTLYTPFDPKSIIARVLGSFIFFLFIHNNNERQGALQIALQIAHHMTIACKAMRYEQGSY